MLAAPFPGRDTYTIKNLLDTHNKLIIVSFTKANFTFIME